LRLDSHGRCLKIVDRFRLPAIRRPRAPWRPRVDAKTNEITRVAPLLGELDIRGAVVTADALLTQREIARHIVEDKHADYVFPVKDNQPTLRKDISDLFASQEEEAKRLQRARGDAPPETEAFPPSARDRR